MKPDTRTFQLHLQLFGVRIVEAFDGDNRMLFRRSLVEVMVWVFRFAAMKRLTFNANGPEFPTALFFRFESRGSGRAERLPYNSCTILRFT